MTGALVLRNVRPWGADATDVLMADGAIVGIAPGLDAGEAPQLDGGGALLVPSLVDAHMHLDKTLWGQPWQAHRAGPSREARIAADLEMRLLMQDSIAERAGAVVCQAISMGIGHIRSHVDVEPELGLKHVDALLAVREAFADRIDIQLIAFPQFGLITNPGTAAVMAGALDAGVEVVGGIDPSSIDGDRAGQLDTVFGLADKKAAMIDIHLHEMGDEGALSMEMICERTRALGMAGRVAISHAFCLGSVDAARRGRLINALAEAGVAIITYAPGASPVPPVKDLHKAGVIVAVGSDGVRDTWTPYGNADMLARAMMLAYRSGFRRDVDIELALRVVAEGGAQVLGLAAHELKAGSPADLMAVPAETVAEAVCCHPAERLVLKGGRVIFDSLLSNPPVPSLSLNE